MRMCVFMPTAWPGIPQLPPFEAVLQSILTVVVLASSAPQAFGQEIVDTDLMAQHEIVWPLVDEGNVTGPCWVTADTVYVVNLAELTAFEAAWGSKIDRSNVDRPFASQGFNQDVAPRIREIDRKVLRPDWAAKVKAIHQLQKAVVRPYGLMPKFAPATQTSNMEWDATNANMLSPSELRVIKANGIERNELRFRGKLWQVEQVGANGNGVFGKFFPSGQLQMVFCGFSPQRSHGWLLTFYETGKLLSVDRIKEGHTTLQALFHENGVCAFIVCLRDEQYEGKSFMWEPNGRIHAAPLFRKGKLEDRNILFPTFDPQVVAWREKPITELQRAGQFSNLWKVQ